MSIEQIIVFVNMAFNTIHARGTKETVKLVGSNVIR
jgi:hypothetical protein